MIDPFEGGVAAALKAERESLGINPSFQDEQERPHNEKHFSSLPAWFLPNVASDDFTGK
jgi:hypothetical protein